MTVEQRLAAASQDLEVAFASTTLPGTKPSPAIGDAVHDANGEEIGPILTFVVDPNGQVLAQRTEFLRQLPKCLRCDGLELVERRLRSEV